MSMLNLDRFEPDLVALPPWERRVRLAQPERPASMNCEPERDPLRCIGHSDAIGKMFDAIGAGRFER